MTIREYLDKARTMDDTLKPVGHGKPYSEAVTETMDVWSNDAAYGYAITAMERAGCRRATIDKVLTAMYHSMDEMSVDKAAERFRNY